MDGRVGYVASPVTLSVTLRRKGKREIVQGMACVTSWTGTLLAVEEEEDKDDGDVDPVNGDPDVVPDPLIEEDVDPVNVDRGLVPDPIIDVVWEDTVPDLADVVAPGVVVPEGRAPDVLTDVPDPVVGVVTPDVGLVDGLVGVTKDAGLVDWLEGVSERVLGPLIGVVTPEDVALDVLIDVPDPVVGVFTPDVGLVDWLVGVIKDVGLVDCVCLVDWLEGVTGDV